MPHAEGNEGSFTSWLLDKHNLLEKTAGAVILALEILDLVAKIFQKLPEVPTTQILNFVFLIFVYIQLGKEFRKRFTLKDDDPKKVARILRIWRYKDVRQQKKINELVRSSNILIGQLRNVNNFILATAALYAIFLIKFLVGDKNNNTNHIFHLLFDLTSYVGAFYLLRAFFVMYLPTLEKGRDVLSKKTNPYIWIGVGLMVLDVCLTFYANEPSNNYASELSHNPLKGVFIAEFICGVVNAVIFVLLIARFENKILDIPPYLLVMLYSYAVLQTCLPFVTSEGMLFDPNFSEALRITVFKLVLVGKVALSAMLLYVLSSGRIVYYFMALKNIHDEEDEEKNWKNFRELIMEIQLPPEQFEITYKFDEDSVKYIATIFPANVFGQLSGSGHTPEEAKQDLHKKIQGAQPLLSADVSESDKGLKS
jgi:hypothetical protein